jgi:glycosyltransferase involved in cell wall biosynthesis
MHQPRKRLKVAHVVQHLVRGGIETMALEMIRQADDGLEIHVISLEGDRRAAIGDWPALRQYGERLTWLNKPAGTSPVCLLKLASLLRRQRFDAVHTHHIGPLLYGGLAARMARISNIVHTEHDAWHLSEAANSRLQSRLLRLVRPVYIADTDEVALSSAEYLGFNPHAVVQNGIDTQRFTPGNQSDARRDLGLPCNIQLIGCAARLEHVKGIDIALAALAGLGSSVKLAIAGTGSQMPALKRQAADAGLEDRVIFLGAIDKMPAFYRAIDVFCLPSRNEGLPMAILEAQASGTPVVASAVGGVPIAIDPRSGALVQAESPGDLADALARVLDTGCGRSARNFVEQGFCARRMVEAYARFWRQGHAAVAA